jgi:predicted nucleotidyltransferase
MNQEISNKEGVLSLLASHRKNIIGFGAKQLGLFGSFVRDEQRAGSDIDFLVDFEPEQYKYRNFINLASYLEELSGRKVEVVTRSGLSPYLAPYILNEVEDVPLLG